MKASELIAQLQESIEAIGDQDVEVQETNGDNREISGIAWYSTYVVFIL